MSKIESNDNELKIFDRMNREDRKLAREVRNDAASAMGMRRLEFMRAIAREDQDALDELKMSLVERAGLDFDPDRFQQILDMIIAFIKALMAIFGGGGFFQRN